MKFKKLPILSVVMLCVVVLNIKPVNAGRCNPGTYGARARTECEDCPAGCFCPQDNTYQDCAINHGRIRNYCSSRSTDGFGDGEKCATTNKGAYVLLCPEDFPYSQPGAKSIEECYQDDGKGHKIEYSSNVECEEGTYLPKKKAECAPCKDYKKLGANQYCPGGEYPFSENSDQGIESCSGGLMPNDDKSDCISDTIECEAGQYLPANTDKCEACSKKTSLKSTDYCPGGPLKIKNSKDQGITTCPDGQVADEDRAGCGSITCEVGEYLPADKKDCKSCKNDSNVKANQYCPGGDYPFNKSKNQGIETCSPGTSPSKEKDVCYTPEDAPLEPKKCDPGMYLNASGTCVRCVGSGRYCPGGTYNLNIKQDQGIYDCPGGGTVNGTGDACTVTLNEDIMLYGPGGKNTEEIKQCLNFHNRISDYIKCLFNGKEVQKKQPISTGGGRTETTPTVTKTVYNQIQKQQTVDNQTQKQQYVEDSATNNRLNNTSGNAKSNSLSFPGIKQ